ncbi:MAG: HDOD domain-containing protein [Desulfobacteraceae bacterium]|nr:HDOD domain-containing protein [Desulfobacteraceae bacterium]
MENEKLKERLSSIKSLPTLPVVASNVIQLTQNPDSTAPEIADAISQDQSLSSKVLMTANSAYYGFPGKINTINYAIVVLGLNNIKNIVLSTSIMERFSESDDDFLFDRKQFWQHSLLCGIISKKISEHMGIKNFEEMFMCGLLHDFGKVVLDTYFHEEFVQALEMAKTQEIPIKDAEYKIFGFNHSGVGALLLKRWSLPPSMVKSVEFHHKPDEKKSVKRTASIVHVADYLCRRIGIGSGGDDVTPTLNKKAWNLLELNAEIIKKMTIPIIQEFKSATGFLGNEKDSE